MAAFEVVSRITFKPFDRESVLDFRSARLPREIPPDHDFNPRDHREPKSPINTRMAYFNLLRSVFGPGVLAMPLAISQCGIVMGPLMTLFMGLLIIHMHLTLLNCLNEISRQLKIPYISYRYGFRLALLHGPPIFRCLGRRGPIIITTFMVLSQLGICTVFVIFSTDCLRDIFDWKTSRPAMLLLVLPYMLLEFCMKSLKIVSYVSLCGNVMTLSGLILVLYYIFDDPSGEIMVATTSSTSLLLSTGINLFTLAAVGVVITLDKALENPTVMVKKYGVIKIGMCLSTLISTVFGILGYWSFGTLEENILRSLPYDHNGSMAAIGLYLVAVMFAYPIQCYPAIQILLETIKNHNPIESPSDDTMKIIEIIIRPGFVLMTFFLCYLVPFQAPFVAFVGTLCTTQLAFVFPALMELSLNYPEHYGKWHIYLIKDLAIIIIGVIVWVLGIILNGYLIYIRILAVYSPNFNIG